MELLQKLVRSTQVNPDDGVQYNLIKSRMQGWPEYEVNEYVLTLEKPGVSS